MTLSAGSLALSVLQATLFLAASAVVVRGLIWLLRCSSARTLRLAWLLVLVQGILLLRLSVNIPWYDSEPKAAAVAERLPDQAHHALSRAAVELPANAGLSPPITEPEPYAAVHEGSAAAAIAATPSPHFWKRVDWWQAAVWAWAAGMFSIAAYGLYRYLRFLNRLQTLDGCDERLDGPLRELLAAQGVRRPIPLRAVRNAGPALCLLPSGYEVIVPADIGSRLSPQAAQGHLEPRTGPL